MLSLSCFVVYITTAMDEHPSDVVLYSAPNGESLRESDASESPSLPTREPGLVDLTDVCRAAVTLRADALLAFTTTEMERIGNEAVQLTVNVSALSLVSGTTLYHLFTSLCSSCGLATAFS